MIKAAAKVEGSCSLPSELNVAAPVRGNPSPKKTDLSFHFIKQKEIAWGLHLEIYFYLWFVYLFLPF